MCGIIAYKGKNSAAPIILEGLKNLEYRGYDSWGLATIFNSDIQQEKQVGKISDSSNINIPQGDVGIGHTRWATHGGVTQQNAHPHRDCTGNIACVHNGIVENYSDLKKSLKHHTFTSETDSEVIPHLIEEHISNGDSFEEATKKVAQLLKGRGAFVVMHAKLNTIMVVKNGTPLIIGIGQNEFFIASDVNAFAQHTKTVHYLEDNEVAIIKKDLNFYNLKSGAVVEKEPITIDWEQESTSKQGYEYFLLKEILEQKYTIQKAIDQDQGKIQAIAQDIKNAHSVFLVGCGTAGKVCMTGEYLFSSIARKQTNARLASEFPNYQHYLTSKSLIIAISQSGETADVLEAIDAAREKNAKVISILNVFGSTMMRHSDNHIMVNAGPEQAVVSTKATTAQLAVITLLAYAVDNNIQTGKLLLTKTAHSVNDMLNKEYEAHIKKLARQLKDIDDIYLIGRGVNYPMALEATIKLQETAYSHAEGFAGGELKHGPIALIQKGTPCIVLVANDDVKNEVLANAMEVKARGAYIIGVSPENSDVFDFWVPVPDAQNASPIVNIVPIQLLAYHIAVLRGCDPDRPRNLAKSLTVK